MTRHWERMKTIKAKRKYKRKRGRPPEGKIWCYDTGQYIKKNEVTAMEKNDVILDTN